MTDFDLILLKGEIFALKTLLSPCLIAVAETQGEAKQQFLQSLEAKAIEAIRAAAPAYAGPPTYQEAFVQSGLAVMSALLELARPQEAAPDAPRLQ